MGWIKTLGLGVVMFCMIFVAYFSLFQTMDSDYDYTSGFNYSDSSFAYVNTTTHEELTTSYESSNTQTEGFQNGTSLSSGTAYDNLISGGYNAITTVWNYPTQVYHLTTNILGSVFEIDVIKYKWFYDGITTLLGLLLLFAILTIIFRSNI